VEVKNSKNVCISCKNDYEFGNSLAPYISMGKKSSPIPPKI